MTGDAVARRTPLVELRGVSKRFGGVQALRDVSLSIQRGSVHGLVGENGAGKSTLGKLIAGVHPRDHGQMLVDDEEVAFGSPHDALRAGLTIIAQELALVPQMTVLQNVFLGTESHRLGVLDHALLRQRFQQLADLGFELDPDVVVGGMSVAEQQKVEVLRAIAREARLIVMDEPTASLTPDESARLLDVVRRLASAGTTIIFVSHALEDVLSLCDTVTILRDGEVVRTDPTDGETPDSLVRDMVGRRMDLAFPVLAPPPADAPVALQVRGVSVKGLVDDVSFDIRRGEIVGLAGLIGSGRTSVARALFGALRLSGGQVRVNGTALRTRSPRDAIAAGIAMLPESRKESGLVMGSTITHNISLPHLSDVATAGVVRGREEAERVQRTASGIRVKTPSFDAPVATLSGGNQQKVLFAKWLFDQPTVLIADEPTRGVDVAAKSSIYEILVELASQGMAILLISSELEEILGLSHRVLVMRNGRVVEETTAGDVDSEAVLAAAFGTAGTQASHVGHVAGAKKEHDER